MEEEIKKPVEEDWRLKRFYEILLEADLAVLHDILEKERKKKT